MLPTKVNSEQLHHKKTLMALSNCSATIFQESIDLIIQLQDMIYILGEVQTE